MARRMSLGIEQLSCITLDDGKSGSTRRSIQSKQSKKEFQARKMMTKYQTTWRNNVLAIPKASKKSEKYAKPAEVYESPVKPGAINLEKCPSRSDNLAKANLVRLKNNKAMYQDLGKNLTKKFDKNIEESWNSIYNFYKRCEKQYEMTRKGKPVAKTKASKKSKEEMSKELEAWISMRSLPKPAPKPDPLPQRKRLPISKVMQRVGILAAPKPLPDEYKPPREVPIPIKQSTLNYTITENIEKLSKYPKRLLDLLNEPGPRLPGTVERSALRAEPTPRIIELAKPHVKTATEKKDEKEDIFRISPGALKYIATARIKELAKPIER